MNDIKEFLINIADTAILLGELCDLHTKQRISALILKILAN
jgi:hypothetical protein